MKRGREDGAAGDFYAAALAAKSAGAGVATVNPWTHKAYGKRYDGVLPAVAAPARMLESAPLERASRRFVCAHTFLSSAPTA